MSAEVIVSLCISGFALLFTVLSFRKSEFKDTSADAKELATMNANITYIRNAIDDIKLENRAIKKELDELKSRVIVLEQQLKIETN